MKKILVIRFSSIGDIVLLSPVLRALHEQLGAEVHVATKKNFAFLLEHNPHVAKLHLIDSKVSEITDQLRKENFDFVADLHHNLRSAQVKRAVRKPSASFPKLNIEKWLIVNFKINRLPHVHIVDRYFETVKSLGVINDGKGLEYFIPANQEIDLQTLPATHRNGYTAFVVGGRFATKQLPTEKIISILKLLPEPVIILGGKEDAPIGEAVASVGDRVLNACGKYSFHQSASIVKQAKRVITNDTGLMHVAAAFHKTIFSVWGNTIPEFGMYPYLPGEGSKIIEVKGLSCRPCSKIGYAKCPKGHFKCMREIDEKTFLA